MEMPLLGLFQTIVFTAVKQKLIAKNKLLFQGFIAPETIIISACDHCQDQNFLMANGPINITLLR